MSDESILEQIKSVLRRTDARGFRLHKYGNGREGGDEEFEKRAQGFNADNIERAMTQVEMLWDKISVDPSAAAAASADTDGNDDGSEESDDHFVVNATVYGMKHALEYFRDKVIEHDSRFQYIASGDFTVAILLCGFEIIEQSKKNFNVSFYAKCTPGYHTYEKYRYMKTISFGNNPEREAERNELKRLAAEWVAACKQADHYR